MRLWIPRRQKALGGAGLLVDGVEANRATVSASAVREVRINQDPYSAQYYWPGHEQMEIITRSAADKYHGQFNFLFRDSDLNAQNALAATKPFEQRRVYEGHVHRTHPARKNSGFLISFNRAEEDLDAVVLATLAPSPSNPAGLFQEQRPGPHPRYRGSAPRPPRINSATGIRRTLGMPIRTLHQPESGCRRPVTGFPPDTTTTTMKTM